MQMTVSFLGRLGLVLWLLVGHAQAFDSGPAIGDPAQVLHIALSEHEQDGHTLSRHVGKDDAYLRERLARETRIPAATTFVDIQTAEQAVEQVLAQNRPQVAQWWHGTANRQAFFAKVTTQGRVISRQAYQSQGAKAVGQVLTQVKVRVVLAKKPAGWFVLTAFPDP